MKLNEQMLSIYRDFGFTDVRIKFSDRPEKRVGADAVWDKAEAALKRAVEAAGLDLRAQSGRGRVLRAQARICLARRDRARLAMRHDPGRSQPAGAARRLLYRAGRREDRAGDDPPRHVRLARALHRHSDRALCRPFAALARAGAGRGRDHRVGCRCLCGRGARRAAQTAGLRAEADLRNEKINYKVREHSLAKVPVLLVVGKREAEERTVSVRRLGSQEQQVMTLDAAIKMLVDEAVPPDLRDAAADQGGLAPARVAWRGCDRSSPSGIRGIRLSALSPAGRGGSDRGCRCPLGAGLALLAAFQQGCAGGVACRAQHRLCVSRQGARRRPEQKAMYTQGVADYEKMAASPEFRAGTRAADRRGRAAAGWR